MGFLVPSVFVLGGALALAILATYLLRPRRPTRRVSSTLLWLAALHDLQASRPWRRIPPTVLLLLQLGALAAIVGAFARPFVLSPDATGLQSVVLLDVSASMQATDVSPSRFEAARSRVRSMIDALQPGQAMALIALSAQPRVLAPRTGDRSALQQALADVQPTAESADLPAALSLAASVAQGQPDAQVIVVADGSVDPSSAPQGLPFALRYVGVGTSAENVAVSAFGTRVQNGQVTALASVTNYGAQRHIATLQLLADGRHFDVQTLDLQPGQTADARWDEVPGSAHVLQAQLEEPDALALDNAAWAIVSGDRPTRVALVSDANVFLERALSLRPGVQLTHVFPSDYLTEGDPYDLTVFDGYLPQALPTRGSLLVLHPPAGDTPVTAHEDLPISGISAGRETDPLLADVPLGGIHVSRSRRLDVPAWADVVLQSPETPLLVAGEQGGQRIVVLGFDLHQSDLPLQPAFPVLTQHLLDWLVPTESAATPVVRVGEAVSLVPLPRAQSVFVVAPDGTQQQIAPPFPAPPVTNTQLPGVYRVLQQDAQGAQTESQFAANFLNPRESRVAAGVSSGTAVGSTRIAAASPEPREIWPYVALVGFVILAVEWWAFHRQ
ncbi:MAG: VWA domain-containing protein [Chloroflexi bacterium]|nr:VWA domain-containing protein [Chloroflexota bacterium]